MNESKLRLQLVKTHPTDWNPSTNAVKVSMNLRLDGCIVPTSSDGSGSSSGRIAYSNIVVLDNFIDDALRLELKHFFLGNRDTTTINPTKAEDPATIQTLQQLPDIWERKTADHHMAGDDNTLAYQQQKKATFGVKQHILEQLAAGHPPAIVEIQSRLVKLYPEFDIAHLPSNAIQQQLGGIRSEEEEADCNCFLVNAAAQGDTYRYHVDADPTSFPDDTPWVDTFGDYINGDPNKPLLVTLLVYLNDEWPRDWAADTLFLDADTDTGVFVRPKPGRCILMHQDVLHRVSAPSSSSSSDRVRLSLVWKLVFLPKKNTAVETTVDTTNSTSSISISRPEWGRPVGFGSAARVDVVMRQLALEMREKRQC